MSFSTEVLTRAGGRANNQDRCGYEILDAAGCWVLADGLGGHGGGDAAAQIAVETILESFRQQPDVSARALEAHIAAGNDAIIGKRESSGLPESMRTTVVVLLSDFRRALWAHVGDSRLYHLQDGRIRFQTKDHSVPQALAAAGDILPEEIRFHEDRNRLLRALGNGTDLRPTITPEPTPVNAGDAFLLCSDGFWEPVTEEAIESVFAGSNGPHDLLSRLEVQIRSKGGQGDNYSAIAVFVEGARKR